MMRSLIDDRSPSQDSLQTASPWARRTAPNLYRVLVDAVACMRAESGTICTGPSRFKRARPVTLTRVVCRTAHSISAC